MVVKELYVDGYRSLVDITITFGQITVTLATASRDSRQFPELAYVRGRLRRMRFHHQLRTDEYAPARLPSLGTRTLAVADDGADLAAALATIQRDGDDRTLAACVAQAFGGAVLDITSDNGSGHLDLLLQFGNLRRPLRASELSDGQLRFLFLAAALLAPEPPIVVVLNEPESSLHPDLVPALAQLVVAAAERSQIVLTTHSNALADALLDHDETVGIALRNASGVTSARPITT